MTASALDDIEGVGPTRKKALLKAFGSVKKLRGATAEEILAVKGIPREVAMHVAEALGGPDASATEAAVEPELAGDSLGGDATERGE